MISSSMNKLQVMEVNHEHVLKSTWKHADCPNLILRQFQQSYCLGSLRCQHLLPRFTSPRVPVYTYPSLKSAKFLNFDWENMNAECATVFTLQFTLIDQFCCSICGYVVHLLGVTGFYLDDSQTHLLLPPSLHVLDADSTDSTILSGLLGN